MKRLSLYLFLILFTLQTPSQADDIGDFQIEGMSIGDSLLDYISKDKINNSFIPLVYKTNEYKTIILKINNLKTYDSIEITYKTDDPDYSIQMITGLVFYHNEIEKCRKQKNEVLLEIENLFDSNNIQIHHQDSKHSYDPSGKSLVLESTFLFKSGDLVDIECYDWSTEIEKKHTNWRDNFRISIVDYFFNKWLIEVQYNQ